MKLEGTHTIQSPRERVFQALNDPEVLKKCIPGCESLEKTSDNQFTAKLSAGVGSIKSKFTATVTISDVVPPSHYKLTVEGKGQPGFAKGSGDLELIDKDGATEIQYTGEVTVGGMLASVGQRMIQATGNMLAGKFFKALEEETKEDRKNEESAAPSEKNWAE